MLPDIAIPSFGYKAHASMTPTPADPAMGVTDVAAHDGRMLRRGLLDTTNTGSGVWADSAYRSKKNEAFVAVS